MGQRKRYSKEFKQEAARVAKERNQSALEVVHDLGIRRGFITRCDQAVRHSGRPTSKMRSIRWSSSSPFPSSSCSISTVSSSKDN